MMSALQEQDKDQERARIHFNPTPSSAISISRPPTPPTPATHSSPSFDYHEERRLHLKDEIYFSHRLPRLPPPALNDSSTGGLIRASTLPAPISANHSRQPSSSDASPSAFHPIGGHSQLRQMMMDVADDEDEDEDDSDEDEENDLASPSQRETRGIHQTHARKQTAPHKMYPPGQSSGAPAAEMSNYLQRPEEDEQEQLDLAEERRERILAEDPAKLGRGGGAAGAAGHGGQGAQGAQSGGMGGSMIQENGIGSALDSLYASFAKCLDLRDKYLALSNQRLGDNPRDHDGTFAGFTPRSMGDVLGVKPEADALNCEASAACRLPTRAQQPNKEGIEEEEEAQGEEEKPLPAWKILPPPPPPHWHWRPSTSVQGEGAGGLELERRDSDLPNPDLPNEITEERPATPSDVKSGSKTHANTAGGAGSSDHKKPAGRSDMDTFDKADFEIPRKDEKWTFALNEEGVYEVIASSSTSSSSSSPLSTTQENTPVSPPAKLARIPNLREYFSDLDFLLSVCSDGPAKSFAFRRLKYLASKWSLYCLLNEYQELADMKAVPHRDFYNVRKVDTHIHHSASMNQKHLLRFIKSKLKKAPNEIVIHRDGKDLTLAEVFESLNLTAYDLSIDTLDMHAHQEFHRFDRFNDRYNPTGSSRLREIFLKTDNLLKGKYLAELTKELITDLEQSKYQHCEWRLSIYGRNLQEWDKLAKWVVNNKLISHNVRWLIQVPRLYEVFKGGGLISNFEDLVKNVFQPLFEVTADPSSHPELHIFLQRVVGFDSVDDESKPERRLYRKFPTAKMWDTKQSPPYSYWIYYMYANMSSLNAWRRSRGFNTFVLRPHCGEAGDPDHLSSAFLTSHSISHGILLRKVPALQYLFYLKQIGLAMSPLSNNALFLTYERNPFKDFFRTGLNVSLSTDDPLQFHFTQSHLLEEYSCAAQIYKLTPADMCELARNSVLQSGWEMAVKKHWIGSKWYLPGAAGNDIHKTNVPTSRLVYRHQTLLEELTLIRRGTQSPSATPGHLQTSHPSHLPSSLPVPVPPSISGSGGPCGNNSDSVGAGVGPAPRSPTALRKRHAVVNEGDIGAAAMEPTKRAFPEMASSAGLGGLASLSLTGLGMTGQHADSSHTQGQGVTVGPGVGALDEKIHRKRAESMGKDMKAVHEARR